MEDITDTDYTHLKRVCKDLEVEKLGEYDDFYVQSDILLLALVFETFRNMCLKISDFDPEIFILAPGLTFQAALKKTKVKLLTDINILSTLEKGRF